MDTKEKILNSAQRLIQQSGANGFSYADIAAEVGIRKASLHHHYSTKTDLIAALIDRYSQQVDLLLAAIKSESPSAEDKLHGYFSLYKLSLAENKVCVGGMLSAEMLSLDDTIAPLLTRFFVGHVVWLTAILKEGEQEGAFVLRHTPESHAGMIVSTLQGALMVSRGMQEKTFFDEAVGSLLLSIKR
jgi:TetR/AcrR family transcriptional repressor of nem operon